MLVETGAVHACAILDDGSVQCWGYNYYGQLGLGYRCVTGSEGQCSTDSSTGTNTIGYPQYMTLPAGRTAIGLNAWRHNTCVILDDHSYVCAGYMGNNNYAKSTAVSPTTVFAASAGALSFTYGNTDGAFDRVGIFKRSISSNV